jgi:hypothetical protein
MARSKKAEIPPTRSFVRGVFSSSSADELREDGGIDAHKQQIDAAAQIDNDRWASV